MINRIFLSLVLTFTFLSGYSQFNFGIKFGINQDIQKSSPDINTSSEFHQNKSSFGYINTYHFGFSGDYNLNSKLGIVSELLYSVKGTHYNKTEFTQGFDHKLTYLTMPVLLKYQVLKILDLQSGVEMGYLIKSKD